MPEFTNATIAEGRQLDLIALPLGIVAGIFLGNILTPITTTTTTTTVAPQAAAGFPASAIVPSGPVSSNFEISESGTISK
jgi:hypothetical protein